MRCAGTRSLSSTGSPGALLHRGQHRTTREEISRRGRGRGGVKLPRNQRKDFVLLFVTCSAPSTQGRRLGCGSRKSMEQLLGCAGGQGEKYLRNLIKICNKLREENFS